MLTDSAGAWGMLWERRPPPAEGETATTARTTMLADYMASSGAPAGRATIHAWLTSTRWPTAWCSTPPTRSPKSPRLRRRSAVVPVAARVERPEPRSCRPLSARRSQRKLRRLAGTSVRASQRSLPSRDCSRIAGPLWAAPATVRVPRYSTPRPCAASPTGESSDPASASDG